MPKKKSTKKKRKEHAYLKVKRTKAGYGLITILPIQKGDFVIEYTGERITPEESDRRGGRYLFTVSDTLVLDGKDHKHLARYINHSCRPNCEAEIDEDEKKINISARRNIRADEELTYDYGKEYWDDFIGPEKCACEKCTERRKKN